ncbi:MAG: adenylate/guanylate cyclase domain-containing protein [Verrucomicrobiota bacterium]
MKAIREYSLTLSLLIGILVMSAVVLLWRSGWLQLLELGVYDRMLRHQSRSHTGPSPVVIVGITDEDMTRWKYGWPLTDKVLAELLERIESAGPRAIGVDLYRDVPVPASGDELRLLEDILNRHANLVFIYSLDAKTPPPSVLAGKPAQLGFNDVPGEDTIRATIRRGLLFMSNGQEDVPSFGFQLARLYLERDGIFPEPDPRVPDRLRLGKATFRPFERNDGAYVNADAGGYQFLLDYKGPLEFPRHSLHDVLTGKVPPEVLRDKIVLVGITAKTVKDLVTTPVQSQDFGVQLHAHIIDQLLRAALAGQEPMRSWKDWQEALWIVLWGLAGAGFGYHLRSPVSLTLALAGCGFLLWSVFRICFEAGLWIPLVAPTAACFPSAGLVTSYVSYLERSQRTLLMHLFSRHVSKDIAENVWDQWHLFLDGDRPRPQKLVATVLFTDLKGFSSTSEKMDPALLIDWLNQYMEEMAQVVARHGGVINKYIGDAIMAVFGIPLSRTTLEEISHDATQAVTCALGERHADLKNLKPDLSAAGSLDPSPLSTPQPQLKKHHEQT